VLRQLCRWYRAFQDRESAFWRLIYGDLTDFAVVECCKLFGSDDEQHQTTHWKNVVSDREQFGGDLLASLKLSMEEFFEYWQEMKG
jgi:hypothetical protein